MALPKDEIQIREEVEKLGRLPQPAEEKLYNIALRQDEQMGRQPTNMLLSQVESDQDLMAAVDRGYLTYELFNQHSESSHHVANLQVTLKGIRYCNMFSDDIVANRRIDVTGYPRKK